MDGIRVHLGYAGVGKPAGERTVDPLGLVAKAGVDYLVAGTDKGLRTFRLSRVTSVEPTGEPVVRPPDFDLARAWRTLSGAFQDGMSAVTARARVHGPSTHTSVQPSGSGPPTRTRPPRNRCSRPSVSGALLCDAAEAIRARQQLVVGRPVRVRPRARSDRHPC
ncbi:helix-turn-helix transcriptional regulator [Streptomyces virginiae]|uniref:helix-turn-helix transcriptional regulator n=1 Tax=Streptomyces virginiae TaxID=1961 RepID=UPI003448B1CB